jgi:hypothetical protein
MPYPHSRHGNGRAYTCCCLHCYRLDSTSQAANVLSVVESKLDADHLENAKHGNNRADKNTTSIATFHAQHKPRRRVRALVTLDVPTSLAVKLLYCAQLHIEIALDAALS